MKIINLYGGPGTGKSTTAAGLFYLMKRKGMKVELVTEFAKELVYSKADKIMQDQIFMCATQHHRLYRLNQTGVEYVISDSPLRLCQYYAKYSTQPSEVINKVVSLVDSLYDNYNVFINRTKPYIKLGRKGNEEEAKEADEGIKMLDIKFDLVLDDSDTICQEIFKHLIPKEASSQVPAYSPE